jgi:predicted secreted protein
MAVHIGRDGVIKVGGNSVANLRSFSIEQTADTVEDTVLGVADRTYKTTLKSFTGSADVYWDETDTAQNALDVGESVTIQFYPEGADSGDTYFQGTALVTGVTRSSSFDGMVEASISIQGSGALSKTTV